MPKIFPRSWACPNPAFTSWCTRRIFLRFVSGADWSFPKSISKIGWTSKLRRKIGNEEFSIFKQVKGVCRKRRYHATSDGRADRFRELSRALASFQEMLKILSCATLYTIVARCIPFYTTFGLHLPVFQGFSRHKGIPLGYSIQICGALCTDRFFQICVSELITLSIWSG